MFSDVSQLLSLGINLHKKTCWFATAKAFLNQETDACKMAKHAHSPKLLQLILSEEWT